MTILKIAVLAFTAYVLSHGLPVSFGSHTRSRQGNGSFMIF